jgi:tetratricopeptide (TPR) repeat protein
MTKVVHRWELEARREIKNLMTKLKNNPESSELHFELGRALMSMLSLSAEKEGIKHIEEAIRLKPNFTEAIEFLATMIMDENPTRGTKLAQKAASIYRASGNVERANKILNQAAMHYVYEGWEFLDEGMKKEAIQKAKRALNIYSDCVDALNIYGSVYLDRFRFTEAEKIYVQAIKKAIEQQDGKEKIKGLLYWGVLETRPYMRARHGLGLTYIYLGNFKEALKQFKIMLYLNPNDNQGVRFLLADVYHYLEDPKNAEKYYKKYGEHEGSYNYALLLYSMKEKSRAIDLLKNSIKAVPFVEIMLKSYLKMFKFWQEKGLCISGEPPPLLMHRNAVINAWNENIELAKDYITGHNLKAAYDFCNLFGQLWLKQKGSYTFLLEAMDVAS